VTGQHLNTNPRCRGISAGTYKPSSCRRAVFTATTVSRRGYLWGMSHCFSHTGRIFHTDRLRFSFTELLGLFWTLSIVLYVEDKNPTTFRRLDVSPSSGGWGRTNLLSWAR
jgi:hypothetical protein